MRDHALFAAINLRGTAESAVFVPTFDVCEALIVVAAPTELSVFDLQIDILAQDLPPTPFTWRVKDGNTFARTLDAPLDLDNWPRSIHARLENIQGVPLKARVRCGQAPTSIAIILRELR